jgi:predicted lipoprotein with Yx(FWY)xxD motif
MNMRPLVTLVAAAALVTLQACSSMMGGGMAAPAKMADGMLVGPNGMTLYTFDKDTADSGKSVCNGPCAANWPPLMAAADAPMMSGDYSVITRDDGAKQWAMKGKPLYYWIKDAKPGDKTGDGFNGVWHVVK